MSERSHWYSRIWDPSPQPTLTKDGRKIHITPRGDRFIDREELIHSDPMRNMIEKVRHNKNLTDSRRLGQLPPKDSAQ